ncbi:MAG: hypothetical protein V3T51_01465, partial [Gammaproteobacteria bacterium]
ANAPARIRLPSVNDFRFEDATAKCMASKLAPEQKPRSKKRRRLYRRPRHDRWRFPGEPPDEPDVQNAEYDADSGTLDQAIAAPRGSGHGLFWSFCASILIVMGTSAAFGFVQPLNDLLPERMGKVLSTISYDLGARGTSLFIRADTPANFPTDIEAAGDGDAADLRPLIAPVIPGHPLATAAAAPLPTPPATVAIRPSTTNGDSGHGEQAELSGATAKQTYGFGVTVLKLGTTDSTAAEFATPEPAAAADEGNEDYSRMPAEQQSVQADPPPIANTPAIADEPVSSVAQPPALRLSAAQIDDLLARGEGLLQNGDIISARLLFQRIAAAGDRRGAKGVGMTYDPDVFARLPVAGLTPDREQAEIWYKKAGENVTVPTVAGINVKAVGSSTDPTVARINEKAVGSSTVPTTARINVADTRKSQERRSPERNAACARKYTSYEPSTGLYTAHSGVKRRCRLP